jgi:hypothetical protein
MRSLNPFVILAAIVSASSACTAPAAENVAAAPPAAVSRDTSTPSETWTSAPLAVYSEASEASYLLPYPYYYCPPGYRLVPRQHHHAGASHHHK